MEKKAPSKKQLAARKKFTAMVKKKSAKKKASINDTIIRVPSKTRKVKKITLKRSNNGTFQSIGSEKGFFKNLSELKKANKANGYYFFSAATMRFFKCKIVSELILGRYFITSDTFISSDRTYKETTFNIRSAKQDGNIITLHEKFANKQDAIIYLSKIV